jgi:hypothetical protein
MAENQKLTDDFASFNWKVALTVGILLLGTVILSGYTIQRQTQAPILTGPIPVGVCTYSFDAPSGVRIVWNTLPGDPFYVSDIDDVAKQTHLYEVRMNQQTQCRCDFYFPKVGWNEQDSCRTIIMTAQRTTLNDYSTNISSATETFDVNYHYVVAFKDCWCDVTLVSYQR